MRGSDIMQESLFMVSKLEDFVPEDHPLRPIRLLVYVTLGRRNFGGRSLLKIGGTSTGPYTACRLAQTLGLSVTHFRKGVVLNLYLLLAQIICQFFWGVYCFLHSPHNIMLSLLNVALIVITVASHLAPPTPWQLGV